MISVLTKYIQYKVRDVGKYSLVLSQHRQLLQLLVRHLLLSNMLYAVLAAAQNTIHYYYFSLEVLPIVHCILCHGLGVCCFWGKDPIHGERGRGEARHTISDGSFHTAVTRKTESISGNKECILTFISTTQQESMIHDIDNHTMHGFFCHTCALFKISHVCHTSQTAVFQPLNRIFNQM